jgi:hypothetical protein
MMNPQRGRLLKGLLPALCLALLIQGGARADTSYKLQSLLKSGDTVGGVKIGSLIGAGTLNDAGQLLFLAENAAGGQALLLYAGGNFSALVVGGQDSPGGKWPADVIVRGAGGMNQRGDLVFAATVATGTQPIYGTFFRDAQTQTIAPVALVGMPAVNGMAFEPGPPSATPAINNIDDIALGGNLKNAAGVAVRTVFFRGRDGKLLPVALPDQVLPGGRQMQDLGGAISINDAGMVTFRAHRQGDPDTGYSGYVWENGVLTPVAVFDQAMPNGAKITTVTALRVNNKNRSILVAAHLNSTPDQAGLFRFANGQLTPLVTPGQTMPGGGKLVTVDENFVSPAGYNAVNNISQGNEAGAHLFLGELEDGSEGAYVLDADGKLTLVLQSGTDSALGPVTDLVDGVGVALNTGGQAAFTIGISDDGTNYLALLSPVAQ